MAQRQKACIAVLQRERADLAARLADPAQVAALRAEAASLQGRLQDLNGLKVTTHSSRMTCDHQLHLVHRHDSLGLGALQTGFMS